MPTAALRLKKRSSGFRALLASFVLFGVVTMLVYPHLPAHMASHFDSSGRPSGYLSPAANLTLLLGSCVTYVLVFGVMWYGLRQVDTTAMNLPDTPRWRDPAERAALRDRLADSMLWLASASVAFMSGLLYCLYRANLPSSRGLGTEFWICLLAYLIFMLAWPLLQLTSLFQPESKQPKT